MRFIRSEWRKDFLYVVTKEYFSAPRHWLGYEETWWDAKTGMRASYLKSIELSRAWRMATEFEDD